MREMNSRERIMAAWNGQPVDHVPLTTWCFGLPAPDRLRWNSGSREIRFWYSKRMEHLHTLPQVWELEDDFKRVLAWRSLGLDDILDVSVPWSVDPEVSWRDSRIAAREGRKYPTLVREYETAAGPLRHAVSQTGEAQADGWVVQPDHVPLIEDFNIPRGVEHAVASPSDIPMIRHLYGAPDAEARRWFAERMQQVKRFADEQGVATQAWSAFGMDGVVWLTGTEGAIMMVMDEPEAFGRFVDIVARTDLARTELAASTPGVDMVVARGWYSSTDFWSPGLFDRFVFPSVSALAEAAHKHGKKFAYVMTTGVEILGPRLVDAGVDVLYFVDPIQDRITCERAAELLGGRITLVGGTNALSLASNDPKRIRAEVERALKVLGPTNRFILHPVDALFPDTPWQGVEQLIDAWTQYR